MNRKEIILHLIGELAHFILDRNPERMVISLHQEKGGLHLVVFDDTTRINLWLGGEEYTPREGPAAKEPKG